MTGWIGALWRFVVTKERFLQVTLEFWQKRTKRVLTLEDAREIVENMTSFLEALSHSEPCAKEAGIQVER